MSLGRKVFTKIAPVFTRLNGFAGCINKAMLMLLVTVIAASSSNTLASVSDLSNVFSSLTNHINGTSTLTGSQIDSLTSIFEANKNYLDDNTAIMTDAFNLSELYETTKGPLFINSKTSGGFPREGSADGYELERAIFAIQQAIIEIIYSPSNCQTYQTLFDGKILQTSDYFPGACTPPVDPNITYDVQIKATLPEVWGFCHGPGKKTDRMLPHAGKYCNCDCPCVHGKPGI